MCRCRCIYNVHVHLITISIKMFVYIYVQFIQISFDHSYTSMCPCKVICILLSYSLVHAYVQATLRVHYCMLCDQSYVTYVHYVCIMFRYVQYMQSILNYMCMLYVYNILHYVQIMCCTVCADCIKLYNTCSYVHIVCIIY